VSNVPKNVKVKDFLTAIGQLVKKNFGTCEIREGRKGSSLKIEIFYDEKDRQSFEPALTFDIYHKKVMSKKCLCKVLKTFDKAGFKDQKEELLDILNN